MPNPIARALANADAIIAQNRELEALSSSGRLTIAHVTDKPTDDRFADVDPATLAKTREDIANATGELPADVRAHLDCGTAHRYGKTHDHGQEA